MEKKNILFISSWYPNKLEPTNGNFVQRHAESVALFHHVEVLHVIGNHNQSANYVVEEEVIKGLKTLIIYHKNSKNPLQNFSRRMNSYFLGYKKLQKPDLVHANVLHNNILFAIFLKKKYKIPFVVTEHWTALRKINTDKTSWIIKKTAKLIGNQADYLLPVSHDLLKGLQFLGIKTPMKVIPNVVNTQLFSPKRDANQTFTFIHVSNLIRRKNADVILETALELLEKGYDFILKIGGDGDISDLQKQVSSSKFKNKIDIFGIQTLPEIADKMRKSNCFILFSTDENQPCVIAEAFASGLKVITTNVGGISEFFPEDAGVLLEEIDQKLLEKAMVKILTEHQLEKNSSLVEYASKTFSMEAIGSQYSTIYQKIGL